MSFIWESRVRYFFMLFLLWLPISANADSKNVDNVTEISVIEKKIAETNPDLVESVTQESDSVKLAIYRSYLAKLNYLFYKNKYILDFIDLSKYKKRTIKTYVNENVVDVNPSVSDLSNGIYWLDRGQLDSEECRKKINGVVYKYCSAQDGFEEFHLLVDDKQIRFIHDDAEANARYITTMSLSEGDNQTIFSHFTNKYNYKEVLEHDNYHNYMDAKYGVLSNEEKELLQKQYINGLVADETDEKYLNLPTVEVSGEVQRIFKSQ
jgi:hypothetical protein